jgi:hypothetical protein
MNHISIMFHVYEQAKIVTMLFFVWRNTFSKTMNVEIDELKK